MTVDLSQLEPPNVVDEKDVDTLTAEYLADLHAANGSLGFDTATEGDPLYSLARLYATREHKQRQRINAAIRGQILSAAEGNALDGLGALPDVARLVTDATTNPVTYETDKAYRGAVHRAPASFGTGSKERYERAVLLADSRIASVYAATPNPTELDVEWLPHEGVDPADSTEIETNISLTLEGTDEAGHEYRMLTDVVSIAEASVVSQAVTAYLHTDRTTDPADAIAAAEAALTAYAPEIREVRAVIAESKLYELLDVDGVLKVDLTTPSGDVGPTALTAYEWGTITITAGLASWL